MVRLTFVVAAALVTACAETKLEAQAPGMPADARALVVTYYYLNF
jgi:hypothetical protein